MADPTRKPVPSSTPPVADFEAAFRRLARQHAALADAVATYMSEAHLDRAVRNENARHLAARVFGVIGDEIPADVFPDCCLIGRVQEDGIAWFASGVLVHPKLVLTAAHVCPPGGHPEVIAAGVADRADVKAEHIISVARAVAHKEFPASLHHDIGALVLKTPSTVKPVPIAPTALVLEALETTFAGFGNTDEANTTGSGVKRAAKVTIRAIQRSPGASHEKEGELGFDANLEFVAGGEGADTCDKDSGGPAYITVGGVRLLAGLTSRPIKGAPANTCGAGTIFCRVDAHMSFVDDAAEDNGISIPPPVEV